MKTTYAEWGERPLLWTRPRQLAPAAGHFLTDLLAKQDFGYDAAVVIDWSGEYGWPQENGPMPVELKKPLMFVAVAASPDGKNAVTVHVRVSVDDTFNKDELMGDDLAVIIASLRNSVTKEFALFEKGKIKHGPHDAGGDTPIA